MPFLIAAVVIVAVLCLLNLLLSTAVIRRLREQNERLARLDRLAQDQDPDAGVEIGSPAPAFETTASDGRTVTERDFGGGVVAFVSFTCDACKVQLPHLERYVADAGLPASKVLVVVVDDVPVPDEFPAGLARYATVVVERFGGTVGAPWRAHVFPTFYSLDEGLTVTGSSVEVAGLPDVPAPAVRAG